MAIDLKSLTASTLANELSRKVISSVELVSNCLERIEAHGDLAIFIELTAERALEEARASDERRARSELLSAWDGIPIAWKDLFDIQGLPTTAGAKVRANAEPAKQNAAVVAACNSAGLISLGKTNLSEFAFSGLGLNPHYGTPVNPWSGEDPMAPGGSSSGSAVAVAAGLAPLATGSDTAGSVRVPASFCGIAGFKSSQNRYDMTGTFPLSRSLDSLGGFAHCVADLIGLDRLMRGQQLEPLSNPKPADLEFVIPKSVVLEGVAPDITDCFEDMVRVIESIGAKVRREDFPIFQEFADLLSRHGTLTVAEAATVHKTLLASEEADLMDQRVRTRMSGGGKYTVQDYIHLQWERERLQAETAKQLGDDILLFPTVAITAPPIAELEADDALFVKTNLLALRNTMIGNFLGTPGVSLPIGKDRNGLPIGALLSAPFGQDDRILGVASAVEEAVISRPV